MSNSGYAQISIGGKLPRADAPAMLDILKDEVSDVWNECSGNDKACLDQFVPDECAEDETLWFEDCEAYDAQFPALQEFCREHGLPYVMQSCGDGNGDFIEYWQPGMAQHEIVSTNHDGEATLTSYYVRDLLKSIQKFLNAEDPVKEAPLHISDEGIVGRIAKHILDEGTTDGLALFKEILDKDFPELPGVGDLPAFEIID